MIENRKVKIDNDTFSDYVSEMFSDYKKFKESKSGYTSVPLDTFGNWVVYRYKIHENAYDIITNWKSKKVKSKYVAVDWETLGRMARDLERNNILSGLGQFFITKYPVDTIFAFVRKELKYSPKRGIRIVEERYVLKQVYENWVEYNNDPENFKTHRVYERKEK